MKTIWKLLFYTNVVLALFCGLMGGAHLAIGNLGWAFFSLGTATMTTILAKVCHNYGYDSG